MEILTINILSSKAIKEAKDKIFNSSYIDILNDQEYLSQIIDNIRFFIYDTNSCVFTNGNSLRTYEFGLYQLAETISDSLLGFYSFNIISNIQVICGHFNFLIKNLNSLVNSLDSPTKEDKNINLYSDYGKKRKKESAEKIEILLFGRKIIELTKKKALFILEPSNYIYGLENFNENFKKCNSKKFEAIVKTSTIETY